ncbi:MAG TPA: hypothetical protein VM847_07940 [Tahibacter sp.]|nr:hypothetical protein [Tahibacter sp.]
MTIEGAAGVHLTTALPLVALVLRCLLAMLGREANSRIFLAA